ncbi:hypothetical protein NE702_15845, partial [Mediterraneibacter faecis]|nr:hypothetical protein [Mediterraneibacter faecis]
SKWSFSFFNYSVFSANRFWGSYRLKSVVKLPTHRPRGRLDFQLIYIPSGKGEFYFHGKNEIVIAGNMVF